MDTELTNLLPLERQTALSREYLLRLGTTIAVLVALLIATAGILLVPTYVFLIESAAAKGTHLANIESVLSSADEKALSAHLAVLSSNTDRLLELGRASAASTLIRAVLSISRPGITLSGFSYTPATGKVHGTLAISGIAATRDALRSYQLILQGSPLATAVNLPVSAYAKDANIEFTITLTLSP